MILYVATLLFFPLISTQSTLSNKTRRSYDEPAKPTIFYFEPPQTSVTAELQNAASVPQYTTNYNYSPTKPLGLVGLPSPPLQVGKISFGQENDPNKPVAAQQVLYQFQQSPTDGVGNVHFKQLFQPNVEFTTSTPFFQSSIPGPSPSTQSLAAAQSNQHLLLNSQPFTRPYPHASGLFAQNRPSASIVTPVHHNLLTSHGTNTFTLQQPNNLFFPHSALHHLQQFSQAQQKPKQETAPSKYIYVNGKITLNPVHIIPQHEITPHSVYHQRVYHNQQKLPLISYVQRGQLQRPPHPAGNTFGGHDINGRNNLPRFLPPITNHLRFQPPKELQVIDKPMVKEDEEEGEEDDKEEEKSDEKEEEEDEEKEDDEEEADEEDNDEKEEKEDDEDDDKKDKEDDDKDDLGSLEFEEFAFDDNPGQVDSHFFKPPRYLSFNEKEREESSEIDEQRQKLDNKDSSNDASIRHNHYKKPNKVIKKTKPTTLKRPMRLKKKDNYMFYEGYSSDEMKVPVINNNKPNRDKVRYSKFRGQKPIHGKIQGKYSEQVPIAHKQKVFKERWYVTKDLEGDGSTQMATRISTRVD